MENNTEELRDIIIKSAGRLFARKGFYGVTIKDICLDANAAITDVENIFVNIEGVYVEVLNIGHRNYFNHEIFNEITDLYMSAQAKIDGFIEHLTFHIYEKENWCTKVFAKELLFPSAFLMPLANDSIVPKMYIALTALSVYTNLNRNDPLLLMTFTQCFSPGLRLIALADSECQLLQPILALPPHELCSYLKTYIFAGLDGVRSVNLD